MKITDTHIKIRLTTSLACLIMGMLAGIMAAHSYTIPGFLKEYIGFIQFRPLHTSSIVSWIVITALTLMRMAAGNPKQAQWIKWTITLLLLIYPLIIWIITFTGKPAGREYWEYPAFTSMLLWTAILLEGISILPVFFRIKNAPVYYWMWGTGICFLVITIAENYAWWMKPVFTDQVKDMTVQWKAAGSLVGSWNQLIYGLSIWLMAEISGNQKQARSKIAFSMYFLGLFNLMFNWGHHIYTLPTAPYVRYISYAVSMTEWIIFIKILADWKKSQPETEVKSMTTKLLRYADLWVFINLGLALLMSIPAINLYTHGTHITVAHSMGTTIGINSMLLFAGFYWFISTRSQFSGFHKFLWNCIIYVLPVFWLFLLVMGVVRAYWQAGEGNAGFSGMMSSSQVWFQGFLWTGSLLGISFIILGIRMIKIIWQPSKS